MCAPVLAFASGALGAVGQFQQGQAANAAAIADYKHQLELREHDWRNTLSTWAHRRLEYKNETNSNNEAASRGYAAEQSRLNEQFMSAAFQKQDQLVGLLRSQGMLGELTGNSAAKMNQAMLAQFGRNNATIAANLSSARDATIERGIDINRQLRSANQKAYSQVALAPVAGIAPPAPQLSNPGMGLAIGLAQAGIGAYSAAQGLKAPPAGGGSGGNWGGSGASNFRTDVTIPGINYGSLGNGANYANSFSQRV